MNDRSVGGRPRPPSILSVLGALGLAPFWLPVLAGLAWPRWQPVAADALSVYAAVILSFLAGSRMGMSIVQDRPSSLTLCLSMVPPILAWVLVLVPFNTPAWRFVLLAVALLGHAAWDSRAREAPLWYLRLRWPLTLAATAGLLMGAVVLHG